MNKNKNKREKGSLFMGDHIIYYFSEELSSHLIITLFLNEFTI